MTAIGETPLVKNQTRGALCGGNSGWEGRVVVVVLVGLGLAELVVEVAIGGGFACAAMVDGVEEVMVRRCKHRDAVMPEAYYR